MSSEVYGGLGLVVRKIIVNDLNKIRAFVVLYYNSSFFDAADRGVNILVVMLVRDRSICCADQVCS